ncbi:hypothetical protein VTN96DRAFT_9156 [Rasamsonia emersonii]|uniref:Spindle pole body-associated protein cut12 domain-containing protein n=1 Tax=Rasamsonia emersonii (strain ATCC 16479 / CBS 393.64 / IMI 116815) TaxID=1408163 RepID=A0A0F4YKW5_RASE3|nr:hypothetical protein T310_7294 [Rasamsonia emersonii CBS 393.64]KKA18745.1 hypothetical protein T310_7294 [Rasamsonia emersonii CBS 393.64]
MLGWITGQNGEAAGSADDSKLPEPPETPAPVFAIRAFKSALFGTPGAEEDENGEPSVRPKRHADRLQQREGTVPQAAEERQADAKEDKKEDQQPAPQSAASPTKSILVTPGTTSNRRKTVSFGDVVLHNDQEKDLVLSKTANTTFHPPSGNVSCQWMSGQSEGKSKPRSKLTQTLLDAREESTKEELPRHIEPAKIDKGSAKETQEAPVLPKAEENNDETINLDEPRSQSGQYWKAEFENYRKKTNLEMRKLIQYRSAAKSYARKKDAEALRLAEKLRAEEAKVAEMERQVTGLASNMVGGAGDADKEKLLQELAKQTALAVQYKHKVDTLRKALEQHGVVGSPNEQQEAENPSKGVDEELRKTQQALEQANATIEEMKRQQGDLKKLQDLVQSSERKASELEKENYSLKETLARVKQEMNKYEGRRKEKEAKLKQREAKLESRIQEYREKLKAAAKERREAEDALKRSFQEERKGYQEQIEALKSKITTLERLARVGHSEESAYNPRKDYTGVQVQDFGAQHGQLRKQAKYNSQHDFHDSRRPGGGVKISEQDAEPLIWLDDSPPRLSHRRSNTLPGNDDLAVPPSSPPPLPENRHLKHPRRSFESPRPTMITFPTQAADREDHPRTRQRHPPKKDASDTFAAQHAGSAAHVGSESMLHSRVSLASVKRDALSPERIAAAKARLKQKEESRKKGDGKENIREVLI